MRKKYMILVLIAATGGMDGCMGLSGESSEGNNGNESGGGGDSDNAGGNRKVSSAVTSNIRAHWLDGSEQLFTYPLLVTATGHMGQEPIEWFFSRELLDQGFESIAPTGGPKKPDCEEGSVNFSNSSSRLKAVYTGCRVEDPKVPDVSAIGHVAALRKHDQVWDGKQQFERNLNHSGWSRVYAIEHDNMKFKEVGADSPFWRLSGEIEVRYNALNDIEIAGSFTAAQQTPTAERTTISKYTDVGIKWQPDGVNGTKLTGEYQVTMTADPMPQDPDQGFGTWRAEIKEPVRYAKTETTQLHPYDGKVHYTADSGKTIAIEYEQSGLFMDGVFISWDEYRAIHESDNREFEDFVNDHF